MKRSLLIALLACSAAAAGAQTIYRCGSSTYSEQPCAEGTTVQALRAPDPADAAASRKENERQAKAAEAMERARLKEEARPVAAYIPKEKVEDTPKLHKPEVFTARAPGDKKKPAKKKKKA
jgi:hypothetical protein